jgi:cation transport regulator
MREIYLAAFNSAWTQYASRGPLQREERPIASPGRRWHGYQKVGDRWIARASS